MNEIKNKDFQNDLFSFYLQIRNGFTIKEFEELITLAESINYEDQSILSMLQIVSTQSINFSDFDRLIIMSIKYNNISLFNYVISFFSFNSKPKVSVIPKNLLFGLTQQEFMNENKEIWLKSVLKKSLNSNSTELETITTKLFGRNVLFEDLPSRLIRVCLWAYSNWHNNITQNIQKGFTQNWPHLEVQIIPTNKPDFTDIDNFDVVLYSTFALPIQPRLLEQVVEAGKGLILFSCNGSIIKGDFRYGAFKGLSGTNSFGSFIELGNSNQNDSIMQSVNSFSCYRGAKYSSINPEFQTVATLKNGDPLVLKSEYNKSRVVDFASDGFSADSVSGSGWKSSTDGHLLLANSIVFASGRDN
ncbi:hypothetical protein P9112_003923 [Eukaryota sp. TZLM1-RC]